MAKNLKLKIKNTQLAKAAGLDKVKAKLAKNKIPSNATEQPEVTKPEESTVTEEEQPRRIRARSKSSFAPKDDFEESTSEPHDIQEIAEIENDEAKSSIAASCETQTVASGLEAITEPKKAEKLGPTGRHVKDLFKPEKKEPVFIEKKAVEKKSDDKPKEKEKTTSRAPLQQQLLKKGKKVKDFKDLKPAAKRQTTSAFDGRDRAGLSAGDEERWRKRRHIKQRSTGEENVIRPTTLTIRLPITIKDLAVEMKLKSSQLIQKLFMQNATFTLNDYLDDETTVQFLGSEFGCEITIDTSEEERLQITNESIKEEIRKYDPIDLEFRPPVVTFMGHVDHGKTSLIDVIRKSSIAASEAGAITQHIGAFKCQTAVGPITVLDTPGHEAFSAMRARGAEVTDIVVLVVAGDEGLKEQAKEAINHAKTSNVTIIVAINKCDKPSFDADSVYRELSEVELLPEKWGGQTITVNTSAVTGAGVTELLEMLALQAEILELKANPSVRARGTVLESELHKGLGCVATVLVQNGTLRLGDALVFERHFGRVKTMHDEHGKNIEFAGPSTPVEITGLSGLPAAGDPFISVKNEKEARHIAESRVIGHQEQAMMKRKVLTLENLMEEAPKEKKILNLILRADVQGSVEALKTSLQKIASDKAEVNIIFLGVGEISESDVQLAAASHAVIIGFHTGIENHAESLIKEHKVVIKLHNIIYHAVDEVKALLTELLDKIEEEKEMGEAEIKATFKSSQLGTIAGCLVTEGIISRNHKIRVVRGGEVIWKGSLASIKREKDDVKEIKKGLECGILLDGFTDYQIDDRLQSYELFYRAQEL